MKTAQRSVRLTVLLAAVSTGCGGQNTYPSPSEPKTEQNDAPPSLPVDSPPTPAPSTPPIAERPTTSTPSPEPTPTPAPPPAPGPKPPPEVSPAADWWQVNPAPTSITYEVPACLPVSVPKGTRFAHPCAVTQFGLDGWPVHFQRLDSEGTVVEEAAFSGGTQLWRTLDTYSHGHKVREVREESWPGTEPSFTTTEWSYDASDRIVMETRNGHPGPYFYDEAGHLTLIEHFKDDPKMPARWERFIYGAQGQLEQISYESLEYCDFGPQASNPDCGLEYRERFTYHPNGQLKHMGYRYLQGYGFSWDKEYDDHGLQLSSADSADEHGSETHWTYDAQGRRTEEHRLFQSSQGSSDMWTRWLYTDAGQPGAKRITDDWDLPWSQSPSSGHSLKLNRSFYACGGGDLLFEEQDINEDGVRDGWHEMVRDAAGNLRVERYQGSLVQDALLSRVEYDYSCQ